MPTPLFVGPAEIAALTDLWQRAAADPIDMPQLLRVLENRAGKRWHKKRMTRLSVEIPVGFLVTFSIETGHPAGTCRHMSMSSPRADRVPSPEAVEMVMSHLGFSGGIAACTAVWLEDLEGHGQAVNVVQPVAVAGPGQA